LHDTLTPQQQMRDPDYSLKAAHMTEDEAHFTSKQYRRIA
jgi:hypothetical protein